MQGQYGQGVEGLMQFQGDTGVDERRAQVDRPRQACQARTSATSCYRHALGAHLEIDGRGLDRQETTHRAGMPGEQS